MYKREGIAAAALLWAAFGAGAAAAEETVPPTDAAEVEEVVVQAARIELPRSAIPATIQIIDDEAIATQTALGASTVETVAALVPSFSPTRQKLSGFGETLRGRSPLYLVDGVPQSTPLRDDSRDGFTIDPMFVDRVEVVFGSNAIQGIGATGGAINYVTADAARTDAWGGQLLAQTTFDDGVVGDSLGYKLGALTGRNFGRYDLTVGAAYERRGAYYDAEGRRIGPDGTQGDVQDSASWSLYLQGGVDLTDTRRLELMVNRFQLEGDGDYKAVAGNRTTGLPTTGVRGRLPGEFPSNEVTSAALTYTDEDLFGGELRAQAFGHRYDGVFGASATSTATFVDPAIPGSGFDQSANHSEKFGLKVDYEREFAAVRGLRALAGVDLLRDQTYQWLIHTGRDWVPETTYKSATPFVQLHQSLWDGRVHLSGGLRFENAKLEVEDYTTLAFYGSRHVAGGEPSFNERLVNYGATFEAFDGLTLYGSYAQGFTMPDVGRVLRGINVNNVDVDTYLDVTPVVADNTEVGADYVRDGLTLSAAWFWSASDRGSRLVLKNGSYEVVRERVEIEGLELSARWSATDWLDLGASYAHLEGRTDSNGDGSVDRDLDGVNISPDRLYAYAEATWGPVTGRLQAQHYFEREFEGQPAVTAFEGYQLVDALVSWEAPVATFTVGVQNLLDEQYVSYHADVVAPTGAPATDNFNYFAGRGRAITFGVRKAF